MSRRTTLGPLIGNNSFVPKRSPNRTTARRKQTGATRASWGGYDENKSFSEADSRPVTNKARRSHGHHRHSSNVSLDPRPIGQPDYLNHCLRRILDFLKLRGFDDDVPRGSMTLLNSTRFGGIQLEHLQSPSGRLFCTIFQFIYHQLDPYYDFITETREFAQEVVTLLKRMRYPFQLSKTSLISVGTPHTWGSVAAALVWMIDVIEISEQAPVGNEGLRNDISEGELFYNFLSMTYKQFMKRNDSELLSLQNKLFVLVREENEGIEEKMVHLTATCRRYQEQLGDIENEKKRKVTMKQRLEDYVCDIGKLKSFIEELKQRERQLKQHKVYLDGEKNRQMRELVELSRREKSLDDRISRQQFNRDDIRRMRTQRDDILEAVKSLKQEFEEKSDCVQSMRVEIKGKKDEATNLEKVFGDIRKLLVSRMSNVLRVSCDDVKKLPMTLVSGDNDERSMIVSHDKFGIIESHCKDVTSVLVQYSTEQETAKLNLMPYLHTLQDTVESEEASVNEIKRQIEQLEQTIERRKRQYALEMGRLEGDIQLIEDQIKGWKENQDQEAEADRRKMTHQLEKELFEEEREVLELDKRQKEEERSMMVLLGEVLTGLESLKRHVMSSVETVHRRIGSMYEEVQELDSSLRETSCG